MRLRRVLVLLSLFPAACNGSATVGYNTVSLGRAACDDDALAACENDLCTVTHVFDAFKGSVALGADERDIFFLSSQLELARRPIAGGPVVALAAAETRVMSFVTDATHVYWIEQSGPVRGVLKTGGEPFDASYVVGNPADVAVDASHLYWVFPDQGQVAMATKPRGSAVNITGQKGPTAITTDSTYVYWVNRGDGPNTGELVRAKRGAIATAEVVLSGLDAPVEVTASDGAVYFASKTDVFKWTPGDVAAESLVTGLGDLMQLGVHGATLYGVSSDGLWRVPVNGGARMVLHARPMSALAITCSSVFSLHWLEDGLERYGP